MTHLLRIALPDVPGSLGAVASALGAADVNIEAIEIIEHAPGGQAVDDFFIRLQPGAMPDSAVSAVQRLDGVRVLWVSRYPTAGNLHLDLETAELIASEPARTFEILTEMLPQTFRSDWALIAANDSGRVTCVAATPGAPSVDEGCEMWFPIEAPIRLAVPESWGSMLVAGSPLGSPDRLVAFGRDGGPAILDSELARLGLLAALAASIGRR